MDKINSNLIENIKKLNNKLKSDLDITSKLGKNEIRKRLKDFGSFVKLSKLSNKELEAYKKMACVDGSVNRFGSSFPHYIDLFQGLGKISGLIGRDVFLSDVYSPISNPDSKEEEDFKKMLLAKIEILTAIEAVNTGQIKYLLMDGNLIRYKIENSENYERLQELCLEKEIVLTGFIKEPKTNSLFSLVFDDNMTGGLYDKDLLYGILDIGEGYILNETFNKKIDEGFFSIFLRLSNYPGITSLEMIHSQRQYLIEMAELCYSLTPLMSRGVPLIIDMVDKEVKIDDKMIRALLSAYIDTNLMERFFRSERSMRT